MSPNLFLEFSKSAQQFTSIYTKNYKTDWIQAGEGGGDVRIMYLEPGSMLTEAGIQANDLQLVAFTDALKEKLTELGVEAPEYNWYGTMLFLSYAEIKAETKEEVMRLYNKVKELLNAIWEWFLSILDKFNELFPPTPVEPEPEDIYGDIESLNLFVIGDPTGDMYEKTVIQDNTSKTIVLLHGDLIALTLEKENATPNEIVIVTDILKGMIPVAYNEYDYDNYKVIKTTNGEELAGAYEEFITKLKEQ